MKKTYSSPVTRVIQIRPFAFIAGTATGKYDNNSIKIEEEESMSSRNWSFNDDDEY